MPLSLTLTPDVDFFSSSSWNELEMIFVALKFRPKSSQFGDHTFLSLNQYNYRVQNVKSRFDGMKLFGIVNRKPLFRSFFFLR